MSTKAGELHYDLVEAKLTDEQRARWDEVPEAQRPVIERAIVDVIASQLPQKPRKPLGSGIGRYEAVLARAGLAAKADRPIPPDLDIALTEVGALRDVFVHRAGRIDAKALADAPTLPYELDQLVRIDRAAYRRYSAAIRAYGST